MSVISPEEITNLYYSLGKIVKVLRKTPCPFQQKGKIFEDQIIKELQKMHFFPWKIPCKRILVKGVSSVGHEVDAIFVRGYSIDPMYFAELKWREYEPINKQEVLIFNQKALDIYFSGYIERVRIARLYRIFISSLPLTIPAFKFCLSHGILVLTPPRNTFLNVLERKNNLAIFPPLDWAITKIKKILQRRPHYQTGRKLLIRLENFRSKIFRACPSLPNIIEHNGQKLLEEYRTLIWEVDPNKLLL